MNVDKFGHHVHKRLRLAEVFNISDNVLLRSENGDYDFKTSRLKGVKTPTSTDDAVNKQYIDELIKGCYDKKEIDTKLKSIKSQIDLLTKQCDNKFCTKADLNNLIKSIKK